MNPSPASRAANRLATAPASEREAIVQEAIDEALEQSGFGRSAMGLTYRSIRGEESSGTYGTFGIRIAVAHKNLPVLGDDPRQWTPQERAISDATYAAVGGLTDAFMTAIIAADPDAQARRKAEREQIVSLFAAPTLVEEIPNGYCSRYCCKHLPWFVITTNVGRFTVGWRKRVINIDWTDTKGTKTAAELFAKEDVTKGVRYIHAWSVEKAREYIAAVIGSAA